MWTTTDGSIECVGGWCDTAHLHTEPGGASGWASRLVDADGNEITTATPGYVVTRGSELAALDAGAGRVHENVSDASFEWDAESVGGDAPIAERSLDSLDTEPEPQAGLVDPEVSAQKLASPHAARLAARTFSPWRPPLATSPPEPEPEPEPAPSQSRKAGHGRRERPSCIYMSVTGKDRFDGSRERPVQTLQRVRELMAAEQVTKAVQLTPAGTNPDGSVHHVATDMIDERPRSGAASEQEFAPSFLSQVSPYPPKSSLPHLHGKWNNMTSSLDDQLSLLNSTIRSAELDLSDTEAGTEGEEAAPLLRWSPPRPVAVQLADTRAVLGSPAAATLFFDTSSVPSPPSARPARLVPTPPRQPPKSSPSPSSRSRLSSRLSNAENVATSVEASTIATTIAQVAVGAGFADLNAMVEKTQAEVDADLEKCRTMIARNSRRRHKRAAQAVAVPKAAQPGSSDAARAGNETAQGVQRKPAPRGAAASTIGSGQKDLGLQRHALEVAMADELPQRVTGEGIIPPSAYAVLYWNGERIGQTQVVMSSRQPRWRQTFELAHVKLENEGHNGLEVEVWSLPAGAKTAPTGSVMTPPPTPPISSAASSTSSLEGSSSIGRSASAKLGGSKKLLGKAMWKGKAGEFPEGMLVLALPAPKSSYASSSRLPAISDSNPSVPHDEGPSVVVTSGPRIMIKLIQRSAVHTIRRETLTQHDLSMSQFDNEMEAIMSHIAAADEQLEEKRKEEEAQRVWDARLESHLHEILVGAAKNAAAELRHQAAKTQRRSKLAAARRAAAEIIAECMRVVDIELSLGITTDRQAEAASAATKLQATHRGKQDRAAVAEMKTKKIEEDLGLTGSAEETAAVAKMQAQARGKQARQELAEKKQAATRIAAVHRGNKSRARVQGQAVAATQIAAAQRGRQGRARVAGLRIEAKLGLSEEDMAGIARIQATQRGKAARQELAEQATAATSIQAVQRGKSTRRRRQAVREDGAAAKLQATARGRAARRELEDQKAAATKIAAVQRGKSARRERQAVREDGAAAKLQATARGRAARKDLAEQSDAATKIAAAHRGRQDRARLAQMDLDKPLRQPSQPLVPQMARTPTPSRD